MVHRNSQCLLSEGNFITTEKSSWFIASGNKQEIMVFIVEKAMADFIVKFLSF